MLFPCTFLIFQDAMFVAVCKERGSTATSSAPPSPQEVVPAPPAAATAPPASHHRPHASPSSTQVVRQSVSPSADAAAAGKPKSRGASSTGGSSSGSGSSNSGRFCGACSSVFFPRAVTFSCRTCGKLFHRDCVGYHTNYFPPPDWICPRCPNGERGHLERCVHPSVKGKRVATQHGNMPWCPLCLDDNRDPGKTTAGANTKTKCRGCGLHTHARCLAKLEIGPDGRWPCDECERRRDGVVPGNNPVWLRLKAARLDGDHKTMKAPRPPAWDANTSTAAVASADGTRSPNNERTMLSIGSTSSRPGATTSAPTTPAAAGAGMEAAWRVDSIKGRPGGGGAAATPTPVVPPSPLARSPSSLSAQGSPFSAPSPASRGSPTAVPSFRRLQVARQGSSAPEAEPGSAASCGNAKGKAKAEVTGDDDDVSVSGALVSTRSPSFPTVFCSHCFCCSSASDVPSPADRWLLRILWSAWGTHTTTTLQLPFLSHSVKRHA